MTHCAQPVSVHACVCVCVCACVKQGCCLVDIDGQVATSVEDLATAIQRANAANKPAAERTQLYAFDHTYRANVNNSGTHTHIPKHTHRHTHTQAYRQQSLETVFHLHYSIGAAPTKA